MVSTYVSAPARDTDEGVRGNGMAKTFEGRESEEEKEEGRG